MATFTKQILSGSTDGKAIKVAETATAGTLLHTGSATVTTLDEVWLYAVNTSASAVKLTIEWGEATAPDGNIELTVQPEAGLVTLLLGFLSKAMRLNLKSERLLLLLMLLRFTVSSIRLRCNSMALTSYVSGLIVQSVPTKGNMKVERFTADGTFTPPAGVTYAVAHIRAGGGGVGASSGAGGTSHRWRSQAERLAQQVAQIM
jgi:hypothetical protein